jgi:hypothetical protein
MYTDALARERTVRVALAADDAAPTVLGDVHAVISAYEATVKAYPSSGYSDNALWQAGCLALDAFARFGQPQDKDTGVRLLHKLATTYPTSRLAKLVPEQLASAEQGPPRRATESATFQRSPESAPKAATIGAPSRPPAVGAELAPPDFDPKTIKDVSRWCCPTPCAPSSLTRVPFPRGADLGSCAVFIDLPGTRRADARRSGHPLTATPTSLPDSHRASSQHSAWVLGAAGVPTSVITLAPIVS